MDSKKHILLVEDNLDDELLAIRALKKCSVDNVVSIARDGVDALNILIGNDDNPINKSDIPELIILDLKLPKLNGLEVLKALRKNNSTSKIPVVIMTSSAEESDIVSSYKLGANSYLRKPVDFNEFTVLIDKLATYWLVLNQSAQTSH